MANSATPAGGMRFRHALAALARDPMLKAGGLALAGLPIAFSAVDELGKESGNLAGNVAGAGGSMAGGLAGGLAGAKLGGLGGPWGAAIGFGLGSMAGSPLGAGLTRGAANALQGNTNDELGKQIRESERMARSQIGIQNEAILAGLPAQQAQLALQVKQEQARMEMASRAHRQMLYQEAMLGPSQVPAGAYFDPSFTSALGAIASGALG
jgi:hypothetical protein